MTCISFMTLYRYSSFLAAIIEHEFYYWQITRLGIVCVYPRIWNTLSYVNVLWADNSVNLNVFSSFVMEDKLYAGFEVTLMSLFFA